MTKRTGFLCAIILLGGLFTVATSLTSRQQESKRVIANPFQVFSSEVDSTLDEQHAEFQLYFSDYIINRNKPLPRIELSCNGVIHHFQLDSTLQHNIIVSPGNYKFMMTMSGGFDEIITDSVYIAPSHKMRVGIYFIKTREEEKTPYHPDEGKFRKPRYPGEKVALKPVIYLYSPKDLQADIQLTPNGSFTYTYPAYEKGWKGTVEAGGGMTIQNKRYPYLFWEGEINAIDALVDYSEGYVVEKENITAFLEEKLAEMGLNDQERTDFITFWGPRMVHFEKNHVQFLFNEEYDDIAALNITPKPDHLFRLYMLWTPIPESVTLHPVPQQLSTVQRDGFSVVEWGGSELYYATELSSNH